MQHYPFSKDADLDRLLQEIDGRFGVVYLGKDGGNICVVTEEVLTEEDYLALENVINSHVTLNDYKLIIEKRQRFFDEISKQFKSENREMGITAAGKTKAVLDYLLTLVIYGREGSLEEVIDTIDELIAQGVPEYLAPFVTEARMLEFKEKIQAYIV